MKKPVKVKGYYRSVKGKRVFIKTHRRVVRKKGKKRKIDRSKKYSFYRVYDPITQEFRGWKAA